MPSTYAHYSFGEQVLEHFDDNIKKLISKHQSLFQIGLHGPDVLFYYKPLGSNPVNKIGHELHKKTADKFIKNAKKVILECPDKEAATAYILGFICHFMLDSECHPIVREAEKLGISHSEIETEFERVLMIKNNLEPLSYKPTKHIKASYEDSTCISWFYKGVTPKQIFKALKSMKLYLNLLVAPGRMKRTFIITALRLSGNYKGMIGLIMNYKPNPKCASTSIQLQKVFQEAIIPTANIVNEFYKNLDNSKFLSKRFERDFG
jgi:hypothetical protein